MYTGVLVDLLVCKKVRVERAWPKMPTISFSGADAGRGLDATESPG